MAPEKVSRSQLLTEPRPAGLAVYVHFPWCLNKCPYCDFLSVATTRPQIPHATYGEAVLAELERRTAAALGPLRSVFFGGGTPSLWATEELGRVLTAILGAFGTTEAVEVTVECNPTSFDADKARSLRGVGVSRVSLGVQALADDRLAFLGRLHDAAGALRAVDAALGAGFARVSADLIFGVAGQSPESAAEEAAALADRGVDHISAYALTIEPGTQFGALARKGRLPLLPESDVADSFEAVREALGSRGFVHYEVSNYARGGAFAEHNLGYWQGGDYLGLGCGAWGTVRHNGRRIRYRNTPVPERYTSSAGAWKTADPLAVGPLVEQVEPLDAETSMRERLMLGLRLACGVNVEAAAAELGVEPWPSSRGRAVERLIARRRLERDGGSLRIPPEAWLFADGTIAELM